MKKNRLLALVTAFAVVLLAVGVETAAATDSSPATQAVGQTAQSGQAATAASGAAQVNPTNENVSVRIFSPGDNGSVSQSNTVSSDASAGNLNLTGQSAGQGGGTGTEAAGQGVASEQIAGALGLAAQAGATNTTAPAAEKSKSDGGGTTQQNGVSSGSSAGNANATGQSASQSGSDGCGCGSGSGSQTVGQSASNEQAAGAKSTAVQEGAKNKNVSVRIFSPGDNGDVSQSNSVDSEAKASNANGTKQAADQSGGSGSGTQTIGQSAKNEQAAGAASEATQHGASNENISVRIHSPGHDGDVEQSNSVSSKAAAGNLNLTGQSASQSGGSSCDCGSGTQAVGQGAKSAQLAGASSEAVQTGASNVNVPVRIFSPGDGGSVSQSNDVSSEAKAANASLTHQSAEQTQGGGECCGGTAVQAVGQKAESAQGALALSKAIQAGGKDRCGCPDGASNVNAPVRISSYGDEGDVQQSNSVSSKAAAGNLNGTLQHVDQAQGDGGGTAVQAVGQAASSFQLAGAASLAAQLGAKNVNAPVRIKSGGDGGSVWQSNDVASSAHAGNANATKQAVRQSQPGGECKCGGTRIQAVGQHAKSAQLAFGLSAALQFGAKNHSAPAAIDTKHGGGWLRETNDVGGHSGAANAVAAGQFAGQGQG